MSGQGYHLPISEPVATKLLGSRDENEILDMVSDLLESMWEDRPDDVGGGYKEWNVLLPCLTNGTFDPRGGTYPLNHIFFGGKLLVSEGSIVNLVTPRVAEDIAAALPSLDEKLFKQRFMALYAKEYKGEEHLLKRDCADCYANLRQLQDFYRETAARGLGVVFYTDDPLSYFFDPGGKPPYGNPS
jgi:hypothetical protein